MNNSYTWYQELIKPSWAPPGWLFGPVWTILYIIITVSFGAVFYNTYQGKIPFSVALSFLLNLIFNFAFTPIQFTIKNNLYASIDIILVLLTLIWALAAIFKYARWIAYANIPYLLWVIFATILQLTITNLNR